MGPLGIPELIFIFVLALLIFGPKKLPQLGKTFGKSMAEFRRASNDLRSTFQSEMDAIDRENQEIKKDFDTSTYLEDVDEDSYEYDDTPYSQESSGSSATYPEKSSGNKTTQTANASANGVTDAASATANEISLEEESTPPKKDTDAAEVKT
jgi:sec-independent protein translocase protein TatA